MTNWLQQAKRIVVLSVILFSAKFLLILVQKCSPLNMLERKFRGDKVPSDILRAQNLIGEAIDTRQVSLQWHQLLHFQLSECHLAPYPSKVFKYDRSYPAHLHNHLLILPMSNVILLILPSQFDNNVMSNDTFV